MKIDVSIQIIWVLAAQEANLMEFQSIEPHHLLLAVLKFAELEEPDIAALLRDPENLEHLLQERDEVRSRLNTLSLEVPDQTRVLRRLLRERFGKGGHPPGGGRMIHRSPFARDIFKQAEAAARLKGVAQWSASDLFETLQRALSREVTKVLGKAGVPHAEAVADTPWLNKFGRDLSAAPVTRQGRKFSKSQLAATKDPVCRVLIDRLLEKDGVPVVLIQKGERCPVEVVEALAQYFTLSAAPAEVRGKKIIEIDITTQTWKKKKEKPEEFESALRALLQEAVTAGTIILFLNNLQEFLIAQWVAIFEDALKEPLLKKQVTCIAAISEEDYREYIDTAVELKKLFHPLWIHDIKMPSRL